jgi:uncharacterized protein with ATP-grasp and redox domains
MQTTFDCIPCLIRHSLDSARHVTQDEAVHERVLREILMNVSAMDLRQPPVVMAQQIHRRLRELTGSPDPYRQCKDHFNRMALELLPGLEQRVAHAADPLETAVRLAIAGNIIDLGVKSHVSDAQIHATIDRSLTEPLEGKVEEFREAIRRAESILYLADNAGEIVFDRLLLEQLPRERVTLAVKGRPIINDATIDDAEAAGIPQLVKVIDNGSDAPGTVLADCSLPFRRRFAEADLVIAKGQGNYETLWGSRDRIFFLLQAKCAIIAQNLGCPLGSLVLRSGHAQ